MELKGKNSKKGLAATKLKSSTMGNKTNKNKQSKKTYKSITIASPEAMEADTRNYSASLTPKERLAYLLELNKTAFGETLEKYSEKELWDKKITINNGSGNDH